MTVKGIQTAIMPILILMLIGILIAVWMMSGTVPTLLFYGMDYINPNYFAVSALYVTIVVSMFTGSSFTTVSTIGVALMGIALTTGISPHLLLERSFAELVLVIKCHPYPIRRILHLQW